MTETDTPCVLVEGPGYGDAGFFRRLASCRE